MDGLVEYSVDDCVFCSCFYFAVLCSVSGLVVCAICAERIYEEEGAGGGKAIGNKQVYPEMQAHWSTR